MFPEFYLTYLYTSWEIPIRLQSKWSESCVVVLFLDDRFWYFYPCPVKVVGDVVDLSLGLSLQLSQCFWDQLLLFFFTDLCDVWQLIHKWFSPLFLFLCKAFYWFYLLSHHQSAFLPHTALWSLFKLILFFKKKTHIQSLQVKPIT